MRNYCPHLPALSTVRLASASPWSTCTLAAGIRKTRPEGRHLHRDKVWLW